MKQYTISLRSRIILALVIIVTVTSTLFAVGVLQIKQQLEEVIFGDMVKEQLELFIHQLESNSYDPTSLYNNWAFHYGDNMSTVHPDILALSEGSHHSVIIGNNYFQVEVGKYEEQPAILIYDITDWENLEHELLEMLAWGIAIVMVVAIFMGWSASQSILAPVKALTRRLSTIQPRERDVRISKEFQGSEIAHIASAFDRYLERLDQFVERERSFTAAASHELRTPLSVMLGAIDILESNTNEPAGKRALARIQRACSEMLAFIEATLFLSREDEGTIQDQTPANLVKIIEEQIEDNTEKIKDQDITLVTSFMAEPLLQQPASILQITVSNILRNAIEHTPGGKIEIQLDQNSMSIQDNGSGIPKSDLPHIFDRSYTTKAGGTGLGLNLVKRICDRFNWTIEVFSDVGTGTTVKIVFPTESN